MGSVHGFRIETSECVWIFGGGNIANLFIVFRDVSNDPFGGRAVLCPAQHHTVVGDFRSGKVSRLAAVGHGAVYGVSKAIKAFT